MTRSFKWYRNFFFYLWPWPWSLTCYWKTLSLTAILLMVATWQALLSSDNSYNGVYSSVCYSLEAVINLCLKHRIARGNMFTLSFLLCRLRSIAAHRDHFVLHLSVCSSVYFVLFIVLPAKHSSQRDNFVWCLSLRPSVCPIVTFSW